MKKATSLLLLGLLLCLGGGCSGEEDATTDPTTLCNQLASAFCSKFYSCYSAEQLASMMDVASKDEPSCVDQWKTDLHCATNPTGCKAGQRYDSGKASQCVGDYKAFTCAQFIAFMEGKGPAPAACSGGCS